MPQLSLAVTLPVSGAGTSVEHSTVMSDGHVIEGGVLSSTAITWRQELEFPQSSVANQVRLIVYSCGQPPAMVISDDTTNTAVSQASVAVAVPVSAGRVLSSHSIVTFAGQVMTGGVLSLILIVCAH